MYSSSATDLDRHAYTDSVIHRLDPRGKILGTLFFIFIVVSFPKYAVGPLLIFAFYPLSLAILGNVSIRLLLTRIVLISPFILFVGIFNPLFDKEPMLSVGGVNLSGGWVSFGSIVLRFGLTVGVALVLVATTPFPALCQGLIKMRVPRALVVQLLFLYRYLFVLVDEAGRLTRARELREGEKRRRGGSLRVAAVMLGVLFTRTLDRAERIYRAMLVRGFEGEIRTVNGLRWGWRDSFFLGGVIAGGILFRVVALNEVVGRLLK